MNEENSRSTEEPRGSRDGSPDEDIIVHSRKPPFRPPQRQSSFAQPRSDKTPRTPNRVHFDIDNLREDVSVDDQEEADDWLEEEDYMSNGNPNGRRDSYGQRAPLLTDIEAPSITVANSDFEFSPEELLERPKSGMRSAFMNMANSIMWDIPYRHW